MTNQTKNKMGYIVFYGITTILVLIFGNVLLLQKLADSITQGERFTLTDGKALFKLCMTENKKEYLTKDILDSYENSNTKFKNFLLIEHEKLTHEKIY